MKLGGILTLSAAIILTGCAPVTPEPVSDQVQAAYDNRPTYTGLPTPGPVIRVAGVGDSISEGSAPDFTNGVTGPLSWPNSLPEGMGFAGGWADGGATTQRMVEGIKPVKADVLIVMAGTNDAGRVSFKESAANIKTIITKAKVKRVIVSSIAPRDEDPARALDFNAQLEPFVKSNGWEWVDPWGPVRTDTGQYAPGMASDGVHPTQPAVDIISRAFAKAVLAK